jgi:hypothetical protein
MAALGAAHALLLAPSASAGAAGGGGNSHFRHPSVASALGTAAAAAVGAAAGAAAESRLAELRQELEVKEGMLSAAKALLPNIGAAIGVSLFAILYNMPLNSAGAAPSDKISLIVHGFTLASRLGIVVSILMVAASLLSRSRHTDNV